MRTTGVKFKLIMGEGRYCTENIVKTLLMEREMDFSTGDEVTITIKLKPRAQVQGGRKS